MSDEQKQKLTEYRKEYSEAKNGRMYHNVTDELRQKMRDYQREYRKNMTDEQK